MFRYHGPLSAALTGITLLAFVWNVPQPVRPLVAPLDKWTHFALFFVLCSSYINTATGGFRIVRPWRFLFGFLATAAYGLFTELVQYALPWRSAEPADFVADAAGAAVAMVLCWVLYRLQRRQKAFV